MDTTSRECMFCELPNSECDMVQCDTCELWAHYTCAGVTEEIEERDWSCKKCTEKLQVPKSKRTSKKSGGQKSKSDGGSVHGSNVSLEVKLKRMEEEQRAKEKELEEEMILEEKRMEMERALKEKRRQKEKEIRERQRVKEREMKKRELEEERQMYQQQLAEEAAFLEERRKMQEEFQKAKKKVVRQYSKEGGAVGGGRKEEKDIPFDKKVAFWLKQQGGPSKGMAQQQATDGIKKSPKSAAEKTEEKKKSSKPVLKKAEEVEEENDEECEEEEDVIELSEEDEEDSEVDEEDDDDEEDSEKDDEEDGEKDEEEDVEKDDEEDDEEEDEKEVDKNKEKVKKVEIPKSKGRPTKKDGSGKSQRKQKESTDRRCQQGGIRQPTKLSAEQIAARQAISKHLPVFKGEPEVWPIFISSYEFTTEACGFSNLDNLKRLQDSLQGNALEAVRSRLVLPDSVPDVIEDLRRLFGKPEKLLRTLLSKVRNSPAPRADRLETFIQFGLTVKQLCDHLEAAKLKEHLHNPMLVQELVEKLPPNYKMDWVRFKRGKKGTPLRMFTDFMNDIVSDASEVAEFSLPASRESPAPPSFSKAKPQRKEFMHVHNATSTSKTDDTSVMKGPKPCWVCQRTDHKLRFCDDFKRMQVVDRLEVVERNKLCALCLNNHGTSRCNFKLRCNVGGCQGEHHPLLHRVERAVQLSKVEVNAHNQRGQTVIFRMVPVTLYFGNRALDTLAFFDEGSSTTLVEESVASQLNAKGFAEPLVVTWTGNVKRYENTSQRLDLMLSARGSNQALPLKNVRTVAELKLPKQSLQRQEIAERYTHLRNVPVASYESAEPGIIIGLDNLHVFTPFESRVGQSGEPIAVRTQLGWMIYGPERRAPAAEIRLNFHSFEPISNEGLHELLRDQYVLEDTNSASTGLLESAENQRAREILQATTVRLGDRFETGLLWRDDVRRFPNSYPMAMRRLTALEKKLDKNPELYRNVHQQICDYVTKGYAHKATTEELAEPDQAKIWYLPLNVVLNPRKPGKVRLVWDAAATVDGVSLNSELLSGPDMLQSLPAVINRFRERRVAFGGDIQEMYHQIRIRPEDKSAQRFLFRSNPAAAPEVYVMDVATFGSTCSPCSAQFVKNLNATEFAQEFPEAAVAVVDNHYVDDYYDSADSVEQATKKAKEVKYIHSRGGFHIRNWVSNSPKFLEDMGESSLNPTIHFNRDKDTMVERVLGIIWNPVEDVFCFSTAVRDEYLPVLQGVERPTKRIVLSCVMSMFDPQGLLSPFTVFGRMLIQDLWRTGCDWDDAVDDASYEKWVRWTKVLPLIAAIKVPRSYFGDAKFDDIRDVQLHILTDASKGAYGCVAYFRALVNGEIRCVLVASRVKVAPLKPTSVPRLELQAAVLGARLATVVRKNHSFKVSQQVFWTDSSTVLSWIRSDQRRYKEYVGLRIGEILTLSRLPEWRWIPTKLNVADQLTKWTRDPEMSSAAVWFNGPEFLYRPEVEWPEQKVSETSTEEELRAHLLVHNVALPEEVIDTHRISKWTVLVRTMATVFRFVSNCRRKIKKLPLETMKPTQRQAKVLKPINYPVVRVPLQQSEFQKAENTLIKMVQADAFGTELKILLKNAELPAEKWLPIDKSSLLYKLTPLVDDHGIIRSEGRSEKAEFLPFDLRFPIILPREHDVTAKIVQHLHERFGHGYRETVKNEVQQRFLISKVGAVIANVARSCTWCKVNRNRPQVPRMASLPVQRLTPHLRPFSFVGVDYLGPFTVSSGRRSEKRWIVIFTCLVVRAVHLEVAHSLTTQSCLMAIRRFTDYRGPPLEFFSDNGTNFKGASKEIAAKIRDIDEECANELTSARTKWTFNPPATPHMGGVWERLVRSVKDVLVALDDGRRLTDEILLTAIAEAADIINSRPLVYASQESDEAEALTPNHFLRGVSPNEPWQGASPVNSAQALRDSYRRSQQLTEEMWQRWIREYIPSVNQRTKWFAEARVLKAGDLVYVVDGGKRKCWVRGVVEEPIVSGDGRVRQAWIRTNSGRCKRAAANLAVLEITDGDAEPETTSGTGSRAGVCCGQHDGPPCSVPTEE